MDKNLKAVDVSFDVVDESDDWIVVSKPAPLVVHPTSGKVEPTLLGGVEQLLSYEIANGVKLSIINRLDRETSGLVLLAKKKSAARAFCRAMERRLIHKEYDAICHGWPDWTEQIINAPIIRKGEVLDSPIWVKQIVHANGRPSVTRFKVMKRYEHSGKKFTLLRVYPQTGRMHQIRVHAAHLGFPLMGDKIYGEDETCYLEFIETGWSRRIAELLYLPRHALHASCMRAELDGRVLEWSQPLANDLVEFLEC